VDGAACPWGCVFQWQPGTIHNISAASQPGSTGTQYLFVNWSDGGAAAHTVTAPSSATTYTANFNTQYYLTTVVSPAGAGTVGGGFEMTWRSLPRRVAR
jgi:hypothetical protein